MSIPIQLENVASGYNQAKINKNFQETELALERGLDRLGQAPNQMEADFDMNSNNILNTNRIDTVELFVDGVDVRDVVGLEGPQGPQGPPGNTGPAGNNGADGVSVVDAEVIGDDLFITLSDATEINAGDVRGPQGIQGVQGIPGNDGVGVPSGGTTGQVLAKASSTDHDTEWVEQSGGGGGDVADRTALKALAPSAGDARYLKEAGREGWFIFDASDLSAYVTVDTQEGIYVAPDSDSDGSSGAWVRQYEGALDIRFCGAISGADCTAAFKGVRDLVAAFTGSDGFTDARSGSGAAVYVPPGTWETDEEIDWGTTPVSVFGDNELSSIVKAGSSFTGDSVFTFGSDSDTAAAARNQKCFRVGFNLNDQALPAIRAFGLRDGSRFSDLSFTAFTGTVFLTDWAGSGSTVMNQGLHIENLHAISFEAMSGISIFKLDGLYESNIIGCKVLGGGGADQDGVVGFHIGSRTALSKSCRGVSIIGCSVGNLNPTVLNDTSLGILIESAEYIHDIRCTFERIDGYGIQYGSAAAAPNSCVSDWSRFYNPGGDTMLKAVRFYSGQYNKANLVLPTNTIANFVKFESAPLHCEAHVITNATPNGLAGGSGGITLAGSTNRLTGLANGRAFSISGGSALNPAVMQNGMFGSRRVTLADDTAQTIFTIPTMSPSPSHVVAVISSGSSSVYGILVCYGGGSAVPIIIAGGSNLEVSNAALTGTTGNDGKLTVSTPNGSSDIVVENRRGANLSLSFTVLGAM